MKLSTTFVSNKISIFSLVEVQFQVKQEVAQFWGILCTTNGYFTHLYEPEPPISYIYTISKPF